MNETALYPVRMGISIYGNGDYDGKRKPFPSACIDDALSQNKYWLSSAAYRPIISKTESATC